MRLEMRARVLALGASEAGTCGAGRCKRSGEAHPLVERELLARLLVARLVQHAEHREDEVVQERDHVAQVRRLEQVEDHLVTDQIQALLYLLYGLTLQDIFAFLHVIHPKAILQNLARHGNIWAKHG